MNTNLHFYAHEPAGVRKQRLIAEVLEREQTRCGKPSLRILDVGCGNGHLSAFMASLGHSVTAIDTAPVAIATARVEYKNLDVRFLVAGIADISEIFDVVTAFEVCEHVSDAKKFVGLLRARLASSALLIISVPNGWSIEENARRFIQHTALGQKIKHWLRRTTALPKCSGQSHADSPHLHFWGAGKWQKIFQSAGFSLEHIWNVSVFFKQLYYLGLRRFLKPSSVFFRGLDWVDGFLVTCSPRSLADGWIMTWRKK